ncbi:hypothetical protein PybrP1_005019 [[Pythium] brassicae (nom. inval.)]|nr:hypothetical protein PybrP1_005019 [[Pythium] brassicae (nom. inval.)]
MRAFTSNVSLDAWLFGEEKPSEPQPKAASGRANSLPAAQFMSRLPRPKKASFVMPGTGKPAAAAKTKESAAKNRAQQAELPSYPFPVSSKLRKLFQNRPGRLQWNKSRHSLAFGSGGSSSSTVGADDKHQQLTMAAFERLQGHVPFSLKEIVKDPKKLPYLLQWLSTDDLTVSAQTNYHQVLLFLLELEQLQLVPEEQRREQALKIWHKYLDSASEFQISSTLELTVELEQLVRDSIDRGGTALDGFFPVQKLAYMRLTREELPRFLKSSEYLQMLLDTENDTESVPMERILEHFELYFWLHVEYVLKPLLDADRLSLFWKLARVLVDKAQNDSQAVTRSTKDDLQLALEARRMDGRHPAAKVLFNKAQQEIFVMLRSSWFDRFMKSKLYAIALKDSLIHLEREDLKEDSPPKLLSRSFAALAYAHQLRGAAGGGDDESKDDALSSNEETADTRSVNSESKGERESDESESGGGSDSAADDSDDDDGDGDGDDDDAGFSKLLLNLESIIRLTNLPDGLQVHYRPHYEAPSASGGGSALDKSDEADAAVDMVLTFATFVERTAGGEPEGTLLIMPVPNPLKPDAHDADDVRTRVKAFLVPDGRTLIRRSAAEPRPDDTLFPFQQSGRNGFLFGSVYLTYEQVALGGAEQGDVVVYVAKGFCVLSSLPLVHSLRRLVEGHIARAASPSDLFDHDSLRALFHVAPKAAAAAATSPSDTLAAHASSLARRYSSVLNLPLGVLEARVDVSMRPLFEQFGTALALQILGSALLECSVVLVSSQYTLLTECAEAIRVLLRPFAWCHVYAPVLPKPLLSYLQCPTPILVGVHSAFATREDLPSAGFYLVADMDRGTVEFLGEQRVAWRHLGLQDDRGGQIFLPRAFETAKRRLDRILTPGRLRYDRLGGSCADGRGGGDSGGAAEAEATGADEHVRLVCLELFSGLLAGHTNACLVVGDTKESVVIFDETQFLSTRDPADEQFYQALMRAQCFSEIVSAHSIDMKESEGELHAEPSATRDGGAGCGIDDGKDDDGVI